MTGTTPIQMARNLNEAVSDAGLALCALGDILRNTDIESLAGGETSVNHLGYLINILGGVVLENTHYLEEHLKTAEAPPPD